MFPKQKYLLDPKALPSNLWDTETKTLRLPMALADAFVALIEDHDLGHLADHPDKQEGPTGGMSKEDTDKHFAQRFDGGAARVQFALLDPLSRFAPVAEAMLQALAGNRLCLTDAPCGAGAATLALLTNLAELRRAAILPRMPLRIHLIGAELSDQARSYAKELLSFIRNGLEEQAIFVEAEWLQWNVNDPVSNSDLIRRMTLVSQEFPNQLILVANFSGFLTSRNNQKKAVKPFEELFRHASAMNSLAVWMEPKTNKSTTAGGLFSWLNDKVLEPSKNFISKISVSGINAIHIDGNTHVYRMYAPEQRVRVTLSVTAFELGRYR